MLKKDVIIIGAGVGGLTAGALLIKEGFNVKIFEKEKMPGGRAITLDMSTMNLDDYKNLLSRFNMNVPFSEPFLQTIFEKKMLEGYHLDLGFHVFGGEIVDNLKKIFLGSDKNIDIIMSKLYVSNDQNHTLFVTNYEKIKMLPNLLRLFTSGEDTMKELDKTSLSDTIKKYGKKKMKEVLELNPRLITTVNDLNKISTGEVFRTQRQMKLKGVRYPKNGIITIINSLSEFIKEKGGKIHLKTPIKQIIVENGKAIGIVAGDKKIYSDCIISNILIQDLFKIIDEKHFSKEYTKYVKSLQGTASLCAYYSLKNINSELIGKNFVFIERNAGLEGGDVAGMVDFMVSSPESGLAPPNNYLVQSYVICTPDEARDKEKLEKLKEILDKNLENIISDYHENLNWAIYPVIWHLDGVAKTIDNEKPDVVSPIENLYLVGDCVKAPGIGFNCAMNSAWLVKDLLTKVNNK